MASVSSHFKIVIEMPNGQQSIAVVTAASKKEAERQAAAMAGKLDGKVLRVDLHGTY